MAGAVQIPGAAVEAILAHAAGDRPNEACGLLVGRGESVARAVPTGNEDRSPTRYTIPPEQHFAAIRDARRDGLEVVGAYHSHPRGPAMPSPTDATLAFPGFVFVIAGFVPAPHVRAWHLVDGNFEELRLVRT